MLLLHPLLLDAEEPYASLWAAHCCEMLNWQEVTGSKRIVAEAYDPDAETIFVRFPGGKEWWYSACPPHIWEEFTRPGQGRGEYIHQVLNYKPNGRYAT